MPGSKLAAFGGMIPAIDSQLLPEAGAAYAENCWLRSGNLDGIRAAKTLYTAAGGTAIQRVYRIPKAATDKDHIADSYWLEFQNADTTVVESPVANDSFGRRYWAPDGSGPRYNTFSRIAAGSTPYILGVPYSTVAPTVVATGGVSGTTVSRAYVTTWVTSMGEEGAPSPPKLLTGKIDDTWTVTLTPPGGTDIINRDITKVRIYRTVTSSAGVATYFLITELASSATSYVDSQTDAQITANAQLASTGYTPPPTDLKGMVSMPNGMIAGWRSNEVWFCEPYRPHAWPVAYTNSVDAQIVGCGVVGQSLVVCTKKGAYTITGIHPSSMAISKVAGAEPCLSSGSIVETPDGVFYASQNGIVMISAGGAALISRALMTSEQWQTLFKVFNLRMARLGSAFYAFGGSSAGCFLPTAFDPARFEQGDFTGSRNGFFIETTDQRVSMTLLTDPTPATSVINDVWTGEVLVMRGGVVYQVDLSGPTRSTYKWRSKIFQLLDLRNIGAAKVYFMIPPNTPELGPETMGPQASLGANSYGIFRLYAGTTDDPGAMELIYTRELRKSGEIFRPPSGFTAEFWQVEIEARVIVTSIQLANTPKELARV